MNRFLSIVALTVLLVAGAAIMQSPQVRASGESGEPMILPVDPSPLVVETDDGSRSFTIEVADEDIERSAGLMFRTEMADDHGMLFVFEQSRRVAFWMKNTPLPLDLVFVREDGTIAAIMSGEPQSTAVISPDADVRFVLELKAGTAQKAGIGDGDRLRHPQIDKVAEEG
jgi:uncharacterized membrane protein (UPF0127 family)